MHNLDFDNATGIVKQRLDFIKRQMNKVKNNPLFLFDTRIIEELDRYRAVVIVGDINPLSFIKMVNEYHWQEYPSECMIVLAFGMDGITDSHHFSVHTCNTPEIQNAKYSCIYSVDARYNATMSDYTDRVVDQINAMLMKDPLMKAAMAEPMNQDYMDGVNTRLRTINRC